MGGYHGQRVLLKARFAEYVSLAYRHRHQMFGRGTGPQPTRHRPSPDSPGLKWGCTIAR